MSDSKRFLDETDHKILKALKADARASYTEIARVIGVTPSAIYFRIQKLENIGVIQVYTTILNAKKLGYDSSHLVMIKTASKTDTSVFEWLRNFKLVEEMYQGSSKYDIIAKILIDKNSSLDDISNLISVMENDITEKPWKFVIKEKPLTKFLI